MCFAQNVRKVIKEKGYKQNFVAGKMGITYRQLSDILNGRKIIDEKIIMLFCKALEVEPNELFEYKKGA